jgi:hypothetical protein
VSRQPEWTFFGVPLREPTGTAVVALTVHTPEQASELGRYLSDIGKLLAGDLSGDDFEWSWRGRSIGRFSLESRPGHAIEAMRRAGPPPGAERYRRAVRRYPR